MFYRFEANLYDDANKEGLASALEEAADQIRLMSSVKAAHNMRLKGNRNSALKIARHGVVYLARDADLD